MGLIDDKDPLSREISKILDEKKDQAKHIAWYTYAYGLHPFISVAQAIIASKLDEEYESAPNELTFDGTKAQGIFGLNDSLWILFALGKPCISANGTPCSMKDPRLQKRDRKNISHSLFAYVHMMSDFLSSRNIVRCCTKGEYDKAIIASRYGFGKMRDNNSIVYLKKVIQYAQIVEMYFADNIDEIEDWKNTPYTTPSVFRKSFIYNVKKHPFIILKVLENRYYFDPNEQS